MKRFLRATTEAAFGVYNAAGAAIHPHLSSEGFGVTGTPEFWTIESGSGLGEEVDSGSETMVVGGRNLVTELGPTLAAVLVPWATTRVNDAKTAPWANAEVPGDLASMTWDYARSNFDGTLRRERYTGMKCETFSGSCSRAQPKLMVTCGTRGSKVIPNPYGDAAPINATVFPEPGCGAYPPKGDVFLFTQLKGAVEILGTLRTNFDSFAWSLTNTFAPYWDEDHFANAVRLTKRALTVTVGLRLKATPDDWAAYRQGTKGAASFVFTKGGHTLTLDMMGSNYINAIEEAAPIDGEHYYSLTLKNQVDTAACKSFEMTYAAPTP